ncbi:MAG: hypothetical protein KAS87_05130 [Candidatus Omnitrophica bacterium]|nr:hypothetical protein [Candidatus Omnitrophota bacterium]
MILTIIFGLITLIGVMLALPKPRKWILGRFKIFGKDKDESKNAEIFVYRRNYKIYHLAEIYNSGPENIIDLKITLNWENDQGRNNKEVHNFINDGDDPTWTSPHNCNILYGERNILITDFPFKNLKGPIIVNIKGKTHESKRNINITIEVK